MMKIYSYELIISNAILKNPVMHGGTKHIKVKYDTVTEVEKS